MFDKKNQHYTVYVILHHFTLYALLYNYTVSFEKLLKMLNTET